MGFTIDLKGLAPDKAKLVREFVDFLKTKQREEQVINPKAKRKHLEVTVWEDAKLLAYPLTREQIYEDL